MPVGMKIRLLQPVNQSINLPLIHCKRWHYRLHLLDRKLRLRQVRQISWEFSQKLVFCEIPTWYFNCLTCRGPCDSRQETDKPPACQGQKKVDLTPTPARTFLAYNWALSLCFPLFRLPLLSKKNALLAKPELSRMHVVWVKAANSLTEMKVNLRVRAIFF